MFAQSTRHDMQAPRPSGVQQVPLASPKWGTLRKVGLRDRHEDVIATLVRNCNARFPLSNGKPAGGRVTLGSEPRSRVLVADDDEAVGRYAGTVLRSAGFLVDVVTSGHEVTKALSHSSYDACVADINMPGNEQLELVGWLHGGAMVPLILLTGDPSFDTAVAALRGGVLDYIVKPVAADELLRRVRAAVQKGREQRAAAHTQARVAALVEAATHVVEAVAGPRPPVRDASPDYAELDGLQLPADVADCLSPRQREVVHLLSLGRPIPEVAELLGLSVHTVRGHMKAIFAKLGVQSQVALLGKLAGHAVPTTRRR